MSSVAFHIFGRPVHWYGLIISIGVIVGIYLAARYSEELGYDKEMIIDFCLLAIPVSIIGARIYYVIFSLDYYIENPLDIFKIWEGGLAIFGVIIGGVFSAFIFSRWRKVNFYDLCDIVAPSLILGQALGRWGNFFNQEAYGYVINNPKWQWFPAAVFIDANQQWHMATFFYESMWNFLIFFFLLYFKRKRKRRGEIFLAYIVLYSVGRVVIEGLRTDSLYIGPFRVSQVLSGIIIVLGTILFIYWRKKGADIEEINELDLEIEASQSLDEDKESKEDAIEESLIEEDAVIELDAEDKLDVSEDQDARDEE